MTFIEYLAKKYNFDHKKERELHKKEVEQNGWISDVMMVSEFINSACSVAGISYDVLMSRDRTQEISDWRHIMMYLAHKHFPDLSFKTISQLHGRKCHSTSFHGIDKIDEYISINDKKTIQQIKLLEPLLTNETEPSTTAQNQVNAQAKERETSSATFQNNSILAD